MATNIPVVGTVDATTDDVIVHLREDLTRNLSTLFFVGTRRYLRDSDGNLFEIVGDGQDQKAVPVAAIHRRPGG